MPPRLVGPYRILATLGKGGAGTVFRASDRRSGEEVALKLLSAGPALDAVAARRMVREFETLATLSHPNVVRVFDAGVHRGYPYLVMELVDGLDLRSYLSIDLGEPPALPSVELFSVGEDEEGSSHHLFDLEALQLEADTAEFDRSTFLRGKKELEDFARDKEEPDTFSTGSSSLDPSDRIAALEESWPPEETASVIQTAMASPAKLKELNRPERIGRMKDALLAICEALGYIHSHGLVHRDLKPGNILVDEERRVRLMDFGLAKFLAEEASLTARGKVVGTYRYMAPEQALGEHVDGRADLYALGILIYELLAGRPPYDGRTPMELWQQILEREPAPLFAINPLADEQLVRIAHRLMRKDPDDRYQTAEEVFDALIAG